MMIGKKMRLAVSGIIGFLIALSLSGCSQVESLIDGFADKNIESSIDLGNLSIPEIDFLQDVPQGTEVQDMASEALNNAGYIAQGIKDWCSKNGLSIDKAIDLSQTDWGAVFVEKWGNIKQCVVNGDRREELKNGSLLIERNYSIGEFNVTKIYEVSGDPIYKNNEDKTEVQVKIIYQYAIATSDFLGTGNDNTANNSASNEALNIK